MLRLVVWLLLLGATLYVVFWVIDRRLDDGETPRPESRRPTPQGPVGPEDDEDFLRELERQRRQRNGDDGGS